MNYIKSILAFSIVMSILCANTLCISAATVSENTPTTVSLEVNNEIDGDETPSKEIFAYVLTTEDSTTPLPSETRVSIEGEGIVAFDDIVYTTPDIYEYTLEQEVVKADNYTYDNTIYEIKVIVRTDDLGVLTPEVFATKQGDTLKLESLFFVNEYKAPVIPEENDGEVPKTGDTNQVNQLISLATVALACILLILIKRKQKVKE